MTGSANDMTQLTLGAATIRPPAERRA